MLQMRTIDEAHAYLKEKDPNTAITKTALRRLITTKKIASVRVGLKYLVAMEAIEEYLKSPS